MAEGYILEISWGCPSDKWPMNGLFQFDQAKAISNAGRKVVFLALDVRSIRKWRKWGIKKGIKEKIPTYEYNIPLGGFPPFIKYPIQDFAFNQSIKVVEQEFGKPSCIHVHCCQQAIAVRDYCIDNGIPYVITEHITPLNEGTKIEKRKKDALENAKKVIAVSNALARDVKQLYGVDSVVIPNIADLKEFKYIPKQDKEPYEFLSAASVNYGKGFDVLIKAYAKLVNDIEYQALEGNKAPRQTHLTIMGDGPEMSNIKKLAFDLGVIDRISFTGKYIRSEFASGLNESDCFVLPSRSETFGIVYIEALATGTPVIATKCGGPEDFVDENCGLLVSVDDVGQLSETMAKMMKNGRKLDMQKVAQWCSNTFDAQTVAGKILQVINTDM